MKTDANKPRQSSFPPPIGRPAHFLETFTMVAA
jgi:hypothetical protein